MSNLTAEQMGEGFAFFAWHRLRWHRGFFVDHSDVIPRSCQRCSDGWVCRLIWENPRDR